MEFMRLIQSQPSKLPRSVQLESILDADKITVYIAENYPRGVVYKKVSTYDGTYKDGCRVTDELYKEAEIVLKQLSYDYTGVGATYERKDQ